MSKRSGLKNSVIAASTYKMAKEAILNDPKLRRYYGSSVEQIAGPIADKLPTASDIRNNRQIVSIFQILPELGLNIRKSGKEYEQLLRQIRTDCPVEIFLYSRENKPYYYKY